MVILSVVLMKATDVAVGALRRLANRTRLKAFGLAAVMAAVATSLPESDYCQMRRDCRERVEKYFGLSGMVADYAKLYRRVVERMM